MRRTFETRFISAILTLSSAQFAIAGECPFLKNKLKPGIVTEEKQKDEAIRKYVTPELLGRFIDAKMAKSLPYVPSVNELRNDYIDMVSPALFIKNRSNVMWGVDPFMRPFISLILEVEDGNERAFNIQTIFTRYTNENAFVSIPSHTLSNERRYLQMIDNRIFVTPEKEQSVKKLLAGDTIEVRDTESSLSPLPKIRVKLANIDSVANKQKI